MLAVRLGSGDLYEGNSEEEKPDGENPGEGKPEGENPEDKEWDILKHSFSPEWDSEGWRASSKVGTVTQQEDSVNILKPEGAALGTEKLYHWVVSLFRDDAAEGWFYSADDCPGGRRGGRSGQ